MQNIVTEEKIYARNLNELGENFATVTRIEMLENIEHEEEWKKFISLLSQCSKLLEFTFIKAALQKEEAKELALALVNCKNLQIINIQYSVIGNELAEFLQICAQQLHKIKIFNFNNNHLGVVGAKYLLEILKSMRLINTLSLSNNHISNGIRDLAKVLKDLPIKELYLQNTYLGPEDAELLAPMLGRCQTLEILDLSYNYVGSLGLVKLAAAFAKLKKLRCLDLSSNLLYGGFKELALALEKCQELMHLKLNYDMIPSEGIKDIAYSLPKYHKLFTLEFINTNLSIEQKELLYTVMCKTNIGNLEFESRHVHPENVRKLLARNRQRKETFLCLLLACQRKKLRLPSELYNFIDEGFLDYVTAQNIEVGIDEPEIQQEQIKLY